MSNNYSKICFLPVDNGNMTLLKLNDENNTTILYDMYIRDKASDPDDESFDVVEYLEDTIEYDSDNRPFIDVFLLSHHDDDHIKGFGKYFHLGSIDDYNDNDEKIYIKEIWGSARFLKRASKYNSLVDDAKAFNTEMKRRVDLYDEKKSIQGDGDRVRILGRDPDGNTDSVSDIVYEIGDSFSKINEKSINGKIRVNILGPLEQKEEEADEAFKKANRGSVILQIEVYESSYTNKILLTGDAEMDVLEYTHQEYAKELLEYDILLAPHHCSKYSLYTAEDEISEEAKQSLSHNKTGARIVSSCREFGDDAPPHKEAKEEYEDIVGSDNFLYTAGNKENGEVVPIELELGSYGVKNVLRISTSKTLLSSVAASGEAFGHG